MSGTFHIWDPSQNADREAWLTVWQQWPQREIQAHPAYVQLFEDSRRAVPLCAAWLSSHCTVLYPFLLRDLTRETYWSPEIGPAADLITPYGYGGPYTWPRTDDPKVSDAFWASFDAWAQHHHIVSEFVRFSLFSENSLPYPGTRIEHGPNVVRPLDLDDTALWQNVAHKVRKNVQTARQAGVEIQFDPEAFLQADFWNVYHHTMARRQAETGYHLPATFFSKLKETLYPHFCYVHALHEGRLVSSELVLLSEHAVYSFLGGTYAEAFPLRPNDLLKYELTRWARERGKQWYVLGGGYRKGDGIYRYKQAFAPHDVRPFFTGRRILNSKTYQALTIRSGHLTDTPLTTDSDFFPAYRARSA